MRKFTEKTLYKLSSEAHKHPLNTPVGSLDLDFVELGWLLNELANLRVVMEAIDEAIKQATNAQVAP